MPPPFRLAMLGMIPGNGHPYSWSAIINGYRPDLMRQCPYPVIADYLGAAPAGQIGFSDAKVTHIWTDDPGEAPLVAAASLIGSVVDHPEEVIGHVDAVVVATDDGDDHVRRARPFVEAGLPVFVDKPLATNLDDLQTFSRWVDQGAQILSSSGMRYAPEMRRLAEAKDLGDLRWISSFTCKTWERYGIHALEAVFPSLGPGFQSVALHHVSHGDVATIQHQSGVTITLPAIHDGFGGFGKIQVAGTQGSLFIELQDTFAAFRAQLRAFVDFLHSKSSPFPFAHTQELMAILIAGRQSREQNGLSVSVEGVLNALKS